MSNAVVGLLDERAAGAVTDLFYDLERNFGLVGVQAVPWPHVSFAVCTGWDAGAVGHAARQVAATTAPVVAHAEPWVLFPGESALLPAIVRSVVRTDELSALHGRVRGACLPALTDVSPFTAADRWNPHLTLASRDVTPALAGEVLAWLATTRPPAWTGRLDRLGLIEDLGDRHVMLDELALTGPTA